MSYNEAVGYHNPEHVKLDGEDDGIVTFIFNQRRFICIWRQTQLINHKKYYYIAVVYTHTIIIKTYDPL